MTKTTQSSTLHASRILLTPYPKNTSPTIQSAIDNVTPRPRKSPRPVATHISLHPCQPLVTYLAAGTIVVQHTVTRQVLWSYPWADAATRLFAGKSNALKALGTVQRIDFYDTNTLYWSGMPFTRHMFQCLLVQTNTRTLVLNRKASSRNPIRANVSESTVGAQPASNALPLSLHLLLVGCADGTLKCYHHDSSKLIKSIKGLGKGDWTVQLQAANAYRENHCRIIALSKKGVAYLIELEIGQSIEVKPALARIQNTHEHTRLVYDPHANSLWWWGPSSISVWDLETPSPEATRHLNLPAASTCVVQSSTRELIVTVNAQHALTIHDRNGNALYSASLVSLLNSLLEDKDDDVGSVQLQGLFSQPLGPTCYEVVVSTNLGLLMVHLPLTKADRNVYFSAALGSWGKSLLGVHDGELVYSSIDTFAANPVGFMDEKNPVTVWSPPLMGVPALTMQSSHTLLASPSGMYVAILWHDDEKYEILHTPSLMATVGQTRGREAPYASSRACVASGTGVIDFCWVGGDSVFALLHKGKSVRRAPSGESATTPTLLTKSAGKSSRTLNSTPKTKPAKGLKKKIGLLRGKKRRGKEESMAEAVEEDDVSEAPSTTSFLSNLTSPSVMTTPTVHTVTPDGSKNYVELCELIAVEITSTEVAVAPASSTSLGNVPLRGGNRTAPTALFGGPALCVASRSEDQADAHFYTTKEEHSEVPAKASEYLSTGPTLPYPDECVWDEAGRLCALALDNRVSVYLLKDGEFTLLGCKRITSPSLASDDIYSLKFIQNVLYCCTWSSVHCILLGNLEEGVCHMDSYVLASLEATEHYQSAEEAVKSDLSYKSLCPTPISLPLSQPSVLGYQNGSLVVSSMRGVFAVSLKHPLVRIGLLLADTQVERAVKWFDAIPERDHEALAAFAERRGYVDLALDYLPSLSLFTVVDTCMRNGKKQHLDRLVGVVESYGAQGLRTIDQGRGMTTYITGPTREAISVTASIGIYLLGHDRVDVVRRLASECLRMDNQGKKDAFILALLLTPVESDARRLISRAVENAHEVPGWSVGQYVHDYVLQKKK